VGALVVAEPEVGVDLLPPCLLFCFVQEYDPGSLLSQSLANFDVLIEGAHEQ
jgi:hypothetical protein